MRPKLLFADDQGNIYDHPFLEMAGASGPRLLRPAAKDLARLPEMSRLYFHPGCPPYGYDPRKKKFVLLQETKIGRKTIRCNAVSAFIQQGWVRLLLPAMDYSRKADMLPMWAYSTVGFHEQGYYAPAFEIDDNFRWHPDNFDDRGLPARVGKLMREYPDNRLVEHLRRCAVHYHCFAAKNFFHRRWEAPIPTSPVCNSGCLGCISLQPDGACLAPQERISFVPDLDEIVDPFVRHLTQAADPIASFGQGCEGEPIMQWQRISESISAMRSRTSAGTINLNTNGSVPRFVEAICASGLDSIRVSLSSARPDLYTRYYRPKGYGFEDVLESLRIARGRGVFTMINYLIFPGLNDQPSEYDALRRLIREVSPDLIHMKNLNIDPDFYWKAMSPPDEPGMGLQKLKAQLAREFPRLQFGYYNKTRNMF